MAGVRDFTELHCWQRARQWSKRIFELTEEGRFHGDRRLVEQINDSSDSVMANIAEGFGRGTQNEFVLFLGYSLGSLDETRSHLCTAVDRRYLQQGDFDTLLREGLEIRKMTVGLISSMVMPGSGAKYMRKAPSWTEQVWDLYERTTGRQRPEQFRKREEE
jgi:four helix bundle protein